MRDIFITLIVLVGCIYTIKRPYIGVLLWSWLSYMNPHRLAYGFAYDLPFAQMVFILLMGSIVFSKDKKKLPINSITTVWLAFLVFMGVTTAFAYFPDLARVQYVKVLKIQLIVFLTMILITDLQKLKQLIWVIVLSIGYFSVKGGIFTILTGGGHKVWGPAGSFIEDNNGLAVAVLMIIPLMVFLRQTTVRPWIRHALSFAIITSLFTVLGSQSRGALLAIATVGFIYWIKSDKKILSGFVISILGVSLLLFMPESWYERMNTIKTYDEDASALGRLNAWEYSFNAANDNLLGMGFESWSDITFAMYAPNPASVHAAHSIYFTILADHGWIGLLLYLSIYLFSWLKLTSIIRSLNNSKMTDLYILAKMLQVSFLAYFVGGAFLSLSYFDLPWHLVSFVVLLGQFNIGDKTMITSVGMPSKDV